MNIFVAKLNARTSGEALHARFSEFGEVKTAKVIKDRETGRSKQFGFVEMDDPHQAHSAIESLNDTELDGNKIVVKEAQPREESARSGSAPHYGAKGGQSRPHGGFNSRAKGNNSGYRE